MNNHNHNSPPRDQLPAYSWLLAELRQHYSLVHLPLPSNMKNMLYERVFHVHPLSLPQHHFPPLSTFPFLRT